MVGGRRVGDVKHPKSPPGTMIQEVRERGDENMGRMIFLLREPEGCYIMNGSNAIIQVKIL